MLATVAGKEIEWTGIWEDETLAKVEKAIKAGENSGTVQNTGGQTVWKLAKNFSADVNFAATHKDVWENEATNEQVRKWIKAAGVPSSLFGMGWSSMTDEQHEKLRKVMDLNNFEKQPHLFNASFAAWQTMSKDQRVKCVEDVGYPTGFAKQWANRDFTSLPADIKAGLLANGYFKQFVAEQNPGVKFGNAAENYADNRRRESEEQVKEAYHKIQDSRAMPLLEGAELASMIADATGLPVSVVKQAAQKLRLFSASFSASSHWDEMTKDQRQSDANALGWDSSIAGKAWAQLTPEQQAAYQKHYTKETKFGAGFADLTKLASDLLKSGAAESDVRNVLKAQGCTDENQQREVLAAARSYETKEFSGADHHDDAMGFSANSDTMKPGGKFSAKFKASSPKEWWDSIPVEVRRLVMIRYTDMNADDRAAQKKTFDELSDAHKTIVKAGYANYAETSGYSAPSLNGPGLKQDVVNAVLTNPARFAAEKPVLLGDVDKPKPTDSGQPGSEPLPPKPKYATTCPTDDEAKPEKKEFSTAAQAVDYLADHGYVNDRARAVARVDATGKWSAPSGASVIKFASRHGYMWQQMSVQEREKVLKAAGYDPKNYVNVTKEEQFERIPVEERRRIQVQMDGGE